MTPLDADPVSDDELIYRRIPVSQGYYDPRVAPVPSPLALSPLVTTPPDSRCIARKYTSLETAARGRPGKSYYIAVLRAGDLRAAGIEVVSRLLEDAPGHAEIPGLTHEHRKAMPYFEWQTLWAKNSVCESKARSLPRHRHDLRRPSEEAITYVPESDRRRLKLRSQPG